MKIVLALVVPTPPSLRRDQSRWRRKDDRARRSAAKEASRRLGLLRSVALPIEDGPQEGKVRHPVETMLRQRVMGLCAGWEDLNDADALRHDPVLHL